MAKRHSSHQSELRSLPLELLPCALKLRPDSQRSSPRLNLRSLAFRPHSGSLNTRSLPRWSSRVSESRPHSRSRCSLRRLARLSSRAPEFRPCSHPSTMWRVLVRLCSRSMEKRCSVRRSSPRLSSRARVHSSEKRRSLIQRSSQRPCSQEYSTFPAQCQARKGAVLERPPDAPAGAAPEAKRSTRLINSGIDAAGARCSALSNVISNASRG